MQDANLSPQSAALEPTDAPIARALETIQLAVGRFQVPEDADDMLGLAHRMPGVVHVWLNGSTLSLECEWGAVDREAIVARLQHDGYPVRSA